MSPDQIDMCGNCTIHARFQRLSRKTRIKYISVIIFILPTSQNDDILDRLYQRLKFQSPQTSHMTVTVKDYNGTEKFLLLVISYPS
jgi:hypothetical protein